MGDWRDIVDEMIGDAMKSGQFKNLPGEGKPLQLDDDSHVPHELRLAHKLLRDNDMAPEWILAGKELEDLHEGMFKALHNAARAYRNSPATDFADAQWSLARRRFNQAVQQYNRRALNYNLKVPPGVMHRANIDAEREIRRALETAISG